MSPPIDEVPPTAWEATIEIPVVDAAPGHRFALSMRQSLTLVWDIDRLAALGLREGSHAVLKNDALATGVGLALDYGVAFLVLQPLTWGHEEWHLSALREGGVTGTNLFQEGEVVDVSDAELVAFDADPAGSVRAHSAGFEFQSALVRRIGDEAFLYGPRALVWGPLDLQGTWTAPYAQALELATWSYLQRCGSGAGDETIASREASEGGELDRDFTGPDCTAWARDLRRPDEPYTARGPHPSGDGIRRYVRTSDLTASELELMKLQTQLRWLSLANPHLFGVDRIRVGDLAFTASLQHWLTPYGWAVDLHGGVRRADGGAAVLGTVRVGISDGWAYPAVGVDLVDVGLSSRLSLAAGTELWLQPDALRWGGAPRPGGRLSAELAWRPEGRLSGWVGAEAKSFGWAVGLASLEPALYARLGATARLGRPARTW